MPGTAFSPANWTGYDEQSVTNPASALTDFTLLIDISTLSSTWKSMVQSDGGDIRLTKEDGTELPFDVIDWAYVASQPSGFILVQWTGTLAASGVQKIRVWAGYTGGTAEAYGVSETYGQYNAYGPHTYFSLDGAANRVDGTAGSLSGGVSPGDTAAQVGDGTAFDGTDDYINTNVFMPLSDITMYSWLQDDAASSTAVAMTDSYDRWSLKAEQWNNTGKVGLTIPGVGDYASVLNTPTTLAFVGLSMEEGVAVQYRVGASTDSDSIGSWANPAVLRLGSRLGGSEDLDGVMNYIGVCDGALGDAWLEEVYLQTNDQATFWGTWAWTPAGGLRKTALGPHALPMPFSDAYAPKSAVATPVTGSFTATADLSSASLSGLTINIGTLSAVAGLSAAAFTGLVPRVGTMVATADKAQTDMSGVVINIGDGTVSAPLCRFSGTGVTATDPPRVGDFEVMANQASAAMTGVVQQIGDFEALANASAAAFTGAVVRVGQFAKPAALSSAVLSGAVQNIGQFTALSSLSGAFLLGSRTRVGSFAAVSASGVSLSGDVINIGSFSAVSSTSRFTGTGGNTVSATVVNADATHQVTDGPIIAAAILDATTAIDASDIAEAGRVGNAGASNYMNAFVSRVLGATDKVYVECELLDASNIAQQAFGVANSSYNKATTAQFGDTIDMVAARLSGVIRYNNSAVAGGDHSGAIATPSAGDVWAMAFDCNTGDVWFGVKQATGTFSTFGWLGGGDPAAGTSPDYTLSGSGFEVGCTVNGNGRVRWNFGQRPFLYGPPTGFTGIGDF